MMHFTGEKGEIQWCTLIMETDQKLLDLAGSLLQTIATDPRESWRDAQDTEKAE